MSMCKSCCHMRSEHKFGLENCKKCECSEFANIPQELLDYVKEQFREELAIKRKNTKAELIRLLNRHNQEVLELIRRL